MLVYKLLKAAASETEISLLFFSRLTHKLWWTNRKDLKLANPFGMYISYIASTKRNRL